MKTTVDELLDPLLDAVESHEPGSRTALKKAVADQLLTDAAINTHVTVTLDRKEIAKHVAKTALKRGPA